MTLTNQRIDTFTLGDDFDLTRTVAAVPTGQTITQAWFMVKAAPTDLDASALISKAITPTAVDGVGHITDTGAGDTAGALLFQIRAANQSAMVANKNYYYGIKVKLSSGLVDHLETGVFRLLPTHVLATA
jgi:hypothetical protein